MQHELCYAVSDSPTGEFSFGGVLVSNGDIGADGIKDVNNARNSTGNTHGRDVDAGGSVGGSELFSKTTQYIANFCDGSVAGFKYFDLSDDTGPKSISAEALYFTFNGKGRFKFYSFTLE